MTTNKSINYFKAIASSYATTIIITLIGFILTPFILKYVTREEYGFFLISTDILTWIGLMDLGLNAVLNYKASQLSARPNSRKLNKMISTVFFVQLIVSIVFFVIGYLISLNITSFFQVSKTLSSTLETFFIIILVSAILKFGSKIFSSLLISHQKADIDNYIKLLNVFIRSTIIVYLLINNFGLLSLAYAFLIANIISTCLLIAVAVKHLPKLNIKFKYFSINLLKEYYSIGFWFFINGIAGIGIETMERILTAKYLNVETVTTLVLTGRLYLISILLINILSNSSRPMIGQLIGQGKIKDVKKILNSMIRLSTGFALVLLFSVFSGNHLFVTAWVGKENYGGVWIEALILLTVLLKNWILPYSVITSSAMYKIKNISIVRIINLLLFILLSMISVKFIGLYGILLSSSISMLLTTFWYLPYISAQYLSIDFYKLMLSEVKVFLPFLIILLLLSMAFKQLGTFVFTGILGAIFISSVMFVVGSLMWWKFIIDDYGKEKINIIFRRLKK